MQPLLGEQVLWLECCCQLLSVCLPVCLSVYPSVDVNLHSTDCRWFPDSACTDYTASVCWVPTVWHYCVRQGNQSVT